MRTRTKERIEKANAIWTAATKAEKRVLVAKDVLAQINAKKYEPVTGSWAAFTGSLGDYVESKTWEGEKVPLQEAIFEKGPTCECCALGGMMMSCVKYANNVNVDEGGLDFFSGGGATNLKKVFSKRQLELIEGHYECGSGAFPISDAERNFPEAWYELSDIERMTKIMQNIIDNKGTFIPDSLSA